MGWNPAPVLVIILSLQHNFINAYFMGNIRDVEISKAIVSCNEMLVYFPLLSTLQVVQPLDTYCMSKSQDGTVLLNSSS